jgi:hypothetical protein
VADLSITSANVSPNAGATVRSGTAGATIAAGQVVYIDENDNRKLKLAVNTSRAASLVAGVALNGASSGQPIDYVHSGPYAHGATATSTGDIYVLSSTAGGIETSTNASTNDWVSIIGVGISATEMSVRLHASSKQKATIPP